MSSTLIRKRKTDTDDILPALFQMTQTILNCVSTEAQQRLTNIDKMEIIVQRLNAIETHFQWVENKIRQMETCIDRLIREISDLQIHALHGFQHHQYQTQPQPYMHY
jgi:hypothetical protein